MTRNDRPLGPRWYAVVWRWHFYAGLFCLPFVVWLSLTGSLYLWRPQIEAWLDRSLDHLPAGGATTTPDRQVAAALRAVPGATLHRYVVPDAPGEAVRILVTKDGVDRRVAVDPSTLAILQVVEEERRPMRLLFHLHGELLAGAAGSYLVETAACWTVVMLITGLFLWWPRGIKRFAGTLYPRLRAGRRILWRDLHAVTGVWVSIFALVLILTGLPWAKGWGTYLGEIRALTGTARGAVDWTIGGRPPRVDTPVADPLVGDLHRHGAMGPPTAVYGPDELDRVVAAVGPLAIAPPVLVSPPRRAGGPWRAISDAADRPLRSDAEIDGRTGAVLGQVRFAQRHWIDQVVGTGVAVHEGALFGLANQIGGSVTACLLVVLAGSSVVLWWRRRPAGVLGAPPPAGGYGVGIGLATAIAALALAMPMFGATLLLVLLVETTVPRRFDRARHWFGLERATGSPPLTTPKEL